MDALCCPATDASVDLRIWQVHRRQELKFQESSWPLSCATLSCATLSCAAWTTPPSYAARTAISFSL
ncbi:hypothetical protein B0T26DRAFT_695861, partial [Lasiosphaeria miniovina]